MNEEEYMDNDEEIARLKFSEWCELYNGHPETEGDFYYEDERKNH